MKGLRALLIGSLAFLGCGGEPDAPFDELSLRDALRAKPEAILNLQPQVKMALAQRFQAAIGTASPPFQLTDPRATTWGERTLRMDEERERKGQDAMVTAQWLVAGNGWMLESATSQTDRSAPSRPLPALTGPDADATQSEESRALSGRAGAIVELLWRQSAAPVLIRAPIWPVGVTATPDAVFVNPSWLTALAVLEPDQSETPLKPRSGGVHVLGGTTEKQSQAEPEQSSSRSHALSDPTTPSLPTPTSNPSHGDVSCSPQDEARCDRCRDECSCSNCGGCGSSSGCGGTSPSSSGCTNDRSRTCSSGSTDPECCRCSLSPVSPLQVATSGSLAFAWVSAPLWFLLWSDRRRRRQ